MILLLQAAAVVGVSLLTAAVMVLAGAAILGTQRAPMWVFVGVEVCLLVAGTAAVLVVV